MRLVSFHHDQRNCLGVQEIRADGTYILDLKRVQPAMPADMIQLLSGGAAAMKSVRLALAEAQAADWLPASQVRLLAPVPKPGKILCVGHNYQDHLGIGREAPPEFPNFFSKTGNTIIGPGAAICVPAVSAQVDYEAELMVVIGTQACHVPESEALAHVAGYTIFNDVSARDYQKRTSQWMLGKSFDTFGPMGPALVTADEIAEPNNLEMELTVNGAPAQRTNTRAMIFTVPFLVAYLSQVMTLEAGDVIATGTPAKLAAAAESRRFLQAGDVVRITIEQLGTLENPVAAEQKGY